MTKTDIFDIKDIIYDVLRNDNRIIEVETDELNIRVTSEDGDIFLIKIQD